MSDVPLHIKIMASLGIIKVTQKRSPPEKEHCQKDLVMNQVLSQNHEEVSIQCLIYHILFR